MAAGVAHQECRGDATADAARRAIAVHFTRAGVHHAEIALAIDDFSGQLHFAKLDIRDTLCDCIRESGGLACHFDHVVVATNNALAGELHLAAIEGSDIAHAVLSRANQQPRYALPGNHEGWVRRRDESAVEFAILLELEARRRKWML